MKIGFTGTRVNITEKQQQTLYAVLIKLNAQNPIEEAHHGGCVGADTLFNFLLFTTRVTPPTLIIVHPGPATAIYDFVEQHNTVILPRKPYLERNHDIVDACDLIIGVPRTKAEVVRSGTWATVRYARKTGNPPLLIWPNGKTNRKY